MQRNFKERAARLLFSLATAAALLASLSVSGDDNVPGEERKLPPGELGRVVSLGRELIEKTAEHPLTKPYSGNALNCSSCHLNAGTHPEAATFLGVATAYPAWSPREKKVITLEDRVSNCFMRSMNGYRLPVGSEASVAMTAYITWLSEGEPLAMNANAPLGPKSLKLLKIDANQADSIRGGELYAEHCALCHAEDGSGDPDNGPPVWGNDSYNAGAGLAQVDKLAAWLKVSMPLDDPFLTDQEALDIASFVNGKPRPKFVLEDHLSPPAASGSGSSAQ